MNTMAMVLPKRAFITIATSTAEEQTKRTSFGSSSSSSSARKSRSRSKNYEHKHDTTAEHRTSSIVLPRGNSRRIKQHDQTSQSQQNCRRRRSLLYGVFIVVLLIAYNIYHPPLHLFYDPLPPIDVNRNAIYVPGTGFLGFWLLLGRVQSISHYENSHEFHCYSSGCLASTCALFDISVDRALNIALQLQQDWSTNKISRYQVVEYFVKELIASISTDDDKANSRSIYNKTSTTMTFSSSTSFVKTTSACSLDLGIHNCTEPATVDGHIIHSPTRSPSTSKYATHNEEDEGDVFSLLKRLHIYTVTRDGGGKSTTPRSLEELESLLRATIWIPFVTGDTLWYHDLHTNTHHVDGGFGTTLWPNNFVTSLYTPTKFTNDIFWNLFNLNISPHLAMEFYHKGYQYGI